MGVLDNIRGRKDSRLAQSIAVGTDDLAQPQEPVAKTTGTDEKPDPEANMNTTESDSDRLSLEARNEKDIVANPDKVTADAQAGVKKAEAAALVYGKKTVWAIYAWVWVSFFMLAFQSSISNNVIVYAYSNFKAAEQITTANICATIIGGILKLPVAKSLNIMGRAEAWTFWVGVYVLGLIIMAACNGPDSYAAGYVLFWLGYDGLYMILDVFMADLTGLKNRAFAWGFASTPFIATAFLGPLAAESFLRMTTWRWAYGAFCIIMPFVFLPFAIIFKFYQRKAERLGILTKSENQRSIMQTLVYYAQEFDIIGMFILMAAFLLFLLPFSLVTYQQATYNSAKFIAMVVIGILLFPVFVIWELYFATTHFMRWELFRQRTVLGAFCLAAVLYFSFYSWDLYYLPYCYVMYNLSVRDGGYMSQIYNIGSCLCSALFGLYIRWTRHFKYACLCFGIPLMFLGAGLMIHFRGQDGNDIGYVVMCQIFIAFAGGILVIGEDMAVMAAADREGVPLMLATLYLATSIGGSIGYAVSGSIYASTFTYALTTHLPAEQLPNLEKIYTGGYLYTMTNFPKGTATREAIDFSWAYAQKYECITATVILVLAIPSVAIWKNYSVDRKQNKGTVL